MPKTVVVIPTYNESENIGPIIARIREFVPAIDILVVDDNSPDGTADVVHSLVQTDPHIKLLSREGKEGVGKAYLNAFDEVLKDPSVEFIQMLDADFSHDPKYLPETFKAAEHADLVIGSRYVKGGRSVGWSQKRQWFSVCANTYCRIITGMKINDCTSGFILMRTRLMRDVGLSQIQTRGHGFMMELKYRMWKQGARVVEVPIILENRVHGTSKLSKKVLFEAALAPWKMRFGR